MRLERQAGSIFSPEVHMSRRCQRGFIRTLLACGAIALGAHQARAQMTEFNWVGNPYIGQPIRCDPMIPDTGEGAWVWYIDKPEIYARGTNSKTPFPILGYTVDEKQAEGVYMATPVENPIVGLFGDFLWIDPGLRIYCSVKSWYRLPLPNGGWVLDVISTAAAHGWRGYVTINPNAPPSPSGGGSAENPTDFAVIGMPNGFDCSDEPQDDGTVITVCVPR